MSGSVRQRENENEKIPKVISDLFIQCETCKTWLRLRPDDGLGRTVPVLIDPLKRRKWVCDRCWDKIDPYQHEELWSEHEKWKEGT